MFIQVAASKTKIYMVLEFVNGGELFDRIVSPCNFHSNSVSTPLRNSLRCIFVSSDTTSWFPSCKNKKRQPRENYLNKKGGGFFSS
jgi:hypothetical protein